MDIVALVLCVGRVHHFDVIILRKCSLPLCFFRSRFRQLVLAGQAIIPHHLSLLHFIFHVLQHLRVLRLRGGQSIFIRMNLAGVFIVRVAFYRAVFFLNGVKGFPGFRLTIVVGVPLQGLDTVFVPVVIKSIIIGLIMSVDEFPGIIQRPLAKLLLVCMYLRMTDGVTLIGMVPLVGNGVVNLNGRVRHRLRPNTFTDKTSLRNKGIIEDDPVLRFAPVAVAGTLHGQKTNVFRLPPLLRRKTALQRTDRLIPV